LGLYRYEKERGCRRKERRDDQGPVVEEADRPEDLAEPDEQGDGHDRLDEASRSAIPGRKKPLAQPVRREPQRQPYRQQSQGAEEVGAGANHVPLGAVVFSIG
jgi:hypothetical protein